MYTCGKGVRSAKSEIAVTILKIFPIPYECNRIIHL